MVLNSLSFRLSVKLLISPSYLNEILAGYSNLSCRFFSFITLSTQGLVPLRWGCALPSPNAPGKAPNHIHILKVMKEKNLQPRLLYPARISFKYEGEIKSFTDKQNLREFSTTKPALQQILPPRHAHGDLTSLAPHERLPEILVVHNSISYLELGDILKLGHK